MMNILHNVSNKVFFYIILPIIFFFIGFYLKLLLGINVDFYYGFSQLIFLLSISLIFISITLNIIYKKNTYFYLFSILLISCSSIGLLTSIINADLINTRWLSFGRFDVNDSNDYLNESKNFLINKEFYSPKGRILYPIFYSGLLKIFSLNSTIIQIALALICAIVSFTTSLFIAKKLGGLCAVLSSYFSADFLHENLGGNCTELIGFILGSVSFIYFYRAFLEKKLNIYNLALFFFALILAFVFRPAPIIIFPVFIIGFFILFHGQLKTREKFFKLLMTPLIIFITIFSMNAVLKQKYSKESPSGFNNVIDSWYATVELGRFIKEDKYHQIPPQLWTKIYKDNPSLNKLRGKDFSQEKNKIFINKVLNEPVNLIIGSAYLIKQFFIVPYSYWDPHHNTTSFMFIDFLHVRVLILALFIIGIVSGIFNYFFEKDKRSLFLSLIGIGIIFSQPFIYGGESRTSAAIINYYILVIFNVITLKKLFFKIFKNYSYKINNYASFTKIVDDKALVYNSNAVCILVIFVIMSSFLLPNIGKINSEYVDSFCLDRDKKKINVVFHSSSGFNLAKNLNADDLRYNYGIDHFLDILSDQIIMLNSYTPLSINTKNFRNNLSYLTKEDMINRDKFPWITNFFFLSTPRIFGLDEYMLNKYEDLFRIFSQGGGFFISPFNLDDNEDIGMVVIPSKMVKNGINNLTICKLK